MSATPVLYQIKPSDLPAPPQLALAMLRVCARDDVDNKLLAEFAQTDPVLSAEILRVVNTPLFGIAHEVMSVRHAVSLLGAHCGLDQDECFTAGLLQDFGPLILFYLHPEPARGLMPACLWPRPPVCFTAWPNISPSRHACSR